MLKELRLGVLWNNCLARRSEQLRFRLAFERFRCTMIERFQHRARASPCCERTLLTRQAPSTNPYGKIACCLA